MKRRIVSIAILTTACMTLAAESFTVTVSNKSTVDRKAAPVVINLSKTEIEAMSAVFDVRSAIVTDQNGNEIPSQLDDLDGNGTFDELCFITDIAKQKELTFSVQLLDSGKPREYNQQVYVEMLMSNKKVKSNNKQNLYISSLTVDNGTNPYWMLHHHGPAFENDMVAYRIYFDHRQTVDIYGKYKRGLELKQTQFYPDDDQKAAGFGDDVLWVGQTFGLGTLRGWDGTSPQMLKDVDHRTLSIVSRGPLRTIVKVEDKGWKCAEEKERIDMTTYYILYAGRRDCFVDIKFNRNVADYQFATGLINVKNSEEMSDKQGLRGCWGTDWPVSAKDSAGHKRETVGLGICIPQKNIVAELPANKDNYPYVVGSATDRLQYSITFASDNETFASDNTESGHHSQESWFEYLKSWKEELENPITVEY